MSKIIDFHSHVLPGIDDGSSSVETSIQMLRREAEQGIEHVIATPHFYAQIDSPDRFLKRRAEAERRLREVLVNDSGLPKISVGAEVYYFRGISESDVLTELSFSNRRFVLIEMPMETWQPYMFRELEDIRTKRNIIPVVAHIDRYISPFRTYGIPAKLECLPVMIQANASFFIDRFTRRMAFKMLKNGQIHILGSDCHDLSERAPRLGEAIETVSKHLGEEFLEIILENQNILIDNNVNISDNIIR